ncbi:MAG: TonB-dependent receptor plug domain-containing protein [Bacteroidota bacterium]
MKVKLFLFVLLSVLCINNIFAQKTPKKITITGTVLDVAKSPIANAIIMINGQKTNSLTDAKGTYIIKVKRDASKIGVFTFGSGIKEEDINGRTEINFNFGTVSSQPLTDQTVAPGDEGVNVGYGYVKKKNLTNQVNRIDGSNKKYASYSSISDMIQREVSGVKISGGSIIIQDSKNLWGSVPALIVVDGVYVDGIPDIAPVQVKSIEVLKGSSAAMYGSRGYGGVIIIKTKVEND